MFWLLVSRHQFRDMYYLVSSACSHEVTYEVVCLHNRAYQEPLSDISDYM